MSGRVKSWRFAGRMSNLGTDPSITIRWSAAQVRGERLVKAPKSRKSRRTIAIGPALVSALKAHQKAQVRNVGEDLVFTDERGRPVHPRADYTDWHRLLDDLGIRHYRVHDLRHGTATSLLEAGQDVRVVQEIMGHATPAFTHPSVLSARAAGTASGGGERHGCDQPWSCVAYGARRICCAASGFSTPGSLGCARGADYAQVS